MKILHFSDIHAGSWPSTFFAHFDKRLLGGMNYTFRRRKHVKWERLQSLYKYIEREKPDLVVSTGDFTSISDPKEFAQAREAIAPLVNSTDFDFVTVPGNHDFYSHDKRSVKAREDFFSWANKGRFPLGQYPHLWEHGGVQFLLLDQSRPNSMKESSGAFSLETADKAEALLDSVTEQKVILLGHYPLAGKFNEAFEKRRSLDNADILKRWLELGKIDLAFCGHVHTAFRREESCGSMEICAGSMTIGGKISKVEYDSRTEKFTQSWLDC